MIKTVSLAWVGMVISIGGAPYLQSIVPVAYQYMRGVLKLGSLTIMKEYMTLTMRLMERYFCNGGN